MKLLREIRHSDAEKGTEYYDTLRAYLKSNKNVAVTAQLLSIHRNTVFYRINRLKELFQIDFDDLLLISTIYQQFIAEDLLPNL